MKKLLIICLLVLPGITSLAQQDPQFTMYMFNQQMINPAYVGARNALSINGLYRNQWVSMPGAPETFNIGVHTPGDVNADFSRAAFGAVIFNDRISVFNQTGAYFQYAYRIPLDDQNRTIMSFGLQAGFVNFTANLSELNPRDGFTSDLSINQDIRNAFLPQFGFGAYLMSDKYYAGFSIPHLIQNKYDREAVTTNNQEVARQLRHYFLMGGYVFDLGTNFKLRPQMIAKYVFNSGKNIRSPLSMDYNLSLIVMDRFNIGASFRTNTNALSSDLTSRSDAVSIILETQVTKNLRMGYAYDYNLSELSAYNDGTHEIMIGYDFSQAIKAFATPRFIRYF